MQLEDGRLLVSPVKWKELLKDKSEEELKAQRLYPVHPSFRVIALSLPVSCLMFSHFSHPLSQGIHWTLICDLDSNLILLTLYLFWKCCQ